MRRIVLFLALSQLAWAGPIVEWSVGSGGNGHYYQAMAAPGGISWSAASASATSLGGYLVTITSAAENSFVFSLINSSTYFSQVSGGTRALGPWIGGVRTGPAAANFAWVSGETFTFTNWAANEPSNSGGTENNIVFLSKCSAAPCAPANTWNDLSGGADTFYGSLPAAYVVEYNVNPVPEPGSVTLVAIGILTLIRRKIVNPAIG